MLALLLGQGLVNAANVVLLDQSGKYFNNDGSAKSDLGVVDMVSRTFYLRALADGAHTSALKLPRQSPSSNVMMSIYGVDPMTLPCLESVTISPLEGAPHPYAASLLASALHDVVPEATSLSVSHFPDKRTNLLKADKDFTVTAFADNLNLDLNDPMVSAFLREVHLCKKACDALSPASDKPQMSFLQITRFPTLSKNQQVEATKVLNRLLEYVMQKMPENSIGELVFRDQIDLSTMALEYDSAAFRRRFGLGDDANSSNTTNSTGSVTYMDMYAAQIFYWWWIAFGLIIWFFSYCFCTMVYDDDKMLYTTFDASLDRKNQ